MKVLIDTNVIIDMAIQREPVAKASTGVISLAQTGRFQGYVSASSISDLHYILHKHTGRVASFAFLRLLVTICDVAAVEQTSIESALVSNFKDFEDAIQNQTATANGIGSIVTRNVKDFKLSELQIVTPEQLIERFS